MKKLLAFALLAVSSSAWSSTVVIDFESVANRAVPASYGKNVRQVAYLVDRDPYSRDRDQTCRHGHGIHAYVPDMKSVIIQTIL